MMGNILRERDQQYVANRDDKTQTWRILDSWHEALTTMGPDDEIPDDSPAVTILTEGGFIALVREAGRLGVLQNASVGEDSEEYDQMLIERDSEIDRLKEQLNSTVPKEPHSEGYDLKEKAMDTILKLVSISDLSGLSKKDDAI